MKNKVASSDAISASSANHNNADVLENDSNFRNRSRVKPTTPKAPSAPNRAYEERKKSLLYLKLGVVAGLVVLKAFIGFGAYEVVRMSEHRQFTQAYNTLINNIIPSTNIGISSTVAAGMELVTVIGDIFPNPDSWPNVAYPGFTKLGQISSSLSGAGAFVFSPKVVPEKVKAFEEFAYAYYANHTELYGPDVARSEFGRGIYSYGYPSNWTDGRYHDTTGVPKWNSDKLYLVPALQIVEPGLPQEEQNSGLMLNTRFNDVLCGNAHDRVIDCAAERTSADETCSMLTGLNTLTSGADPYPRAYILQPIFAANGDLNEVVGFLGAILYFNNLLLSHIPINTNGIEYVINLNGEFLTYKITDGKPKFKGLGDLHNRKFNGMKRVVDITTELNDVIHCDEMIYTISFYPTNGYVDQYETNLRWIFCFGAVIVIILVSLVFFWYDYAMMRENSEQQAVLETKRQFVRFISHEVRTPLNAVSMASDLLLEQLLEIQQGVSLLKAGNNVYDGNRAAVCRTLTDSQELCEEIVANTKNAVEVLNDLLNYDKIEMGGLSLEISFFAAECVLDTVIRPFRGPAKMKGVEIDVNMSSYLQDAVFRCPLNASKFGALRIVGDKIRIEQVLRNLVSNALKFTSTGGKIEISMTHEEHGLDSATIPAQIKNFLEPRFANGLLRSRGLSSASLGSNVGTADPDCNVPNNSVANSYSEQTTSASQAHATMTPLNGSSQGKEDSMRISILKNAYVRNPPDPSVCARYGSVRISVTDDGAGLSPEQLQQICADGVQFNANELQAGQGSGLGLFIAKGIVQQHGGTMLVTSDGLNMGSTFTVELPLFGADIFSSDESDVFLRAVHANEHVKKYGIYGVSSLEGLGHILLPEPKIDKIPAAMHASGDPHQKKLDVLSQETLALTPSLSPEQLKPVRRFLVVDDTPSNLKMSTRLLLRNGVDECVQAADGQEAVDKYVAARDAAMRDATAAFEQQLAEQGDAGGQLASNKLTQLRSSIEPFDAILMDFEMPVLNGPLATAKLREIGCMAPILGVTGNVLPEDVNIFKDHGADSVLSKPLKLVDLQAALRWEK